MLKRFRPLLLAALAIGAGGSTYWKESRVCTECLATEEVTEYRFFMIPVWRHTSEIAETEPGACACHFFLRRHVAEGSFALLGHELWSHDTSEGIWMQERLAALKVAYDVEHRLHRPDLLAQTIALIDEKMPPRSRIEDQDSIPERNHAFLKRLRNALWLLRMDGSDWQQLIKDARSGRPGSC